MNRVAGRPEGCSLADRVFGAGELAEPFGELVGFGDVDQDGGLALFVNPANSDPGLVKLLYFESHSLSVNSTASLRRSRRFIVADCDDGPDRVRIIEQPADVRDVFQRH